tara:strand:- start:345 stop:518 length:174 start_codon:yes stop_codon:yes gene_type:complete
MPKKLYRVHATKEVWMVADIEANNEEEALKLAEDGEYQWDENHSQDGGWSYNEAEEI